MLIHNNSLVCKYLMPSNCVVVLSSVPSIKYKLPSPATISVGGIISLAIAVGVGRFAFTPLFPLMVRDGLLTSTAGTLLATCNYLGYFVGALLADRLGMRPETLLRMGLIGIVIVTASVGWTSSLTAWAMLRFLAGVFSAWSLVGTTAWAFAWFALLGHPKWAGAVFAGVGIGIAGTGMFCLLTARSSTLATEMWIELAILAFVPTAIALVVSRNTLSIESNNQNPATPRLHHAAQPRSRALIICYSVFGFGYILPATYLPALARELVNDPRVFGWAWPIFGIAAAVSTVVGSWMLRRFNRVQVWAASQALMAVGVLLPTIWRSTTGIIIAALFVGGTFMVITMVGMQEARIRAEDDATAILARMTAGFAFGQLMGPVASAAFSHLTPDASVGLKYGMQLAAAGLMITAVYLAQENRQQNRSQEYYHG
jgi:MFS family permease